MMLTVIHGRKEMFYLTIHSTHGAHKRPLAANRKKLAHVVAADFLFHYLSDPLPYIHCNITVNKMCLVHH